VTTVSPCHAAASCSRPSAFAHVAAQLDTLAAAFSLDAEARLIREVYGALCRRALDFPLGVGPAAPSRLNSDGTPIQLATVVGSRPAPLRFVADPGPLDAQGKARMSGAFAAMRDVAELIGAEAGLAAVAPLLGEIAPENALALRAHPAGVLWIGAAFAPGVVPRLRIYVNGSWGSRTAQSARLRCFAANFHRVDAWDDLAARFPDALAPLGFALTVTPGEETLGAVYLRAFGLRLSDYAALACAASGRENAERIRAFGCALLGADAAHPTPSAVLSFGFGPEPHLSTELEFCAHCLYSDDVSSKAALEQLFVRARVDPTPYRALISALAPAELQPGRPRLHSFIGTAAKSAEPAYTVYMKPVLSALQ
jgi:hypothetical protein